MDKPDETPQDPTVPPARGPRAPNAHAVRVVRRYARQVEDYARREQQQPGCWLQFANQLAQYAFSWATENRDVPRGAA